MSFYKIYLSLLLVSISYCAHSESYVDANGYIVDTAVLKNASSNKSVTANSAQPYIDEKGYIVTPGIKNITPANEKHTEPTAYLPSLPPQGFPDVSQVPVYTETYNDASKNLNNTKIKPVAAIMPNRVGINKPKISREEELKILACNTNIQTMINKRTTLQNNLSVLNDSILNNRWISDKVFLSKFGYWSELKNIYQWVDIFNVKFRSQNLEECQSATEAMSSFLDFANNSNILIINAIISVNEKEFKIQTETGCNKLNSCEKIYNMSLIKILNEQYATNKVEEDRLVANLRPYIQLMSN